VNQSALVTIAIPAFNPDFLRRTLISALNQDYPHCEVLVCDDSRGEEVQRIVDEVVNDTGRPVRYLRNPQTLGFARNLLTCLEQARGELIKFLCDDDLLFTECVSLQAAVMNTHADVSLTICQRMLCSADDTLLPSRMINMVMCPDDAVVKGSDLLEGLEQHAPNLFGGLSSALLRRALVEEFLPSLVLEGQGFTARLDMALYICMMRRGNLGHLDRFLSMERLHAGRLSHNPGITLLYPTETDWLKAMLAARSSEPAPAKGWVRYVPLHTYTGERTSQWEEYDLNGLSALQAARARQQVGSDCLSFEEVYAQWLECRALSPAQLKLLPKRIEQWPSQPRIVPVIWAEPGEEQALRATLDSFAAQSYAPAEYWVLAPAQICCPPVPGVHHLPLQGNGIAQLQARLAGAVDADWIFLLRAGDRVVPHALAIMAERMVLGNRVCLYVDEGGHDTINPSTPIFKPDFNLDLMRSLPYVGRLLAFECKAVREAGGFDHDFDLLAPHDLLWRLAENCGLQVIGHVDELLVHSQWDYAQWLSDPRCVAQAPRVVRAHLGRLGVDAEVEGVVGQALCRVAYRHEGQASVSILVDVGVDLIAARRCVESLFEHTAYSNFEVLLIAGSDAPTELRQWLQAMSSLGSDQLRLIEVAAQGRVARLNEASAAARGDYLLMLESACVAFEAQWLAELMAQARRPEVGVVGPKLCNTAGSILQAGLVLGLHGEAGSPFVGMPADSGGYMHRLMTVQNWSALSLECLLVRRELLFALGGFDCEALQGELQDADFCLRAGEQGYLAVWTPAAMLLRLTSQAHHRQVQVSEPHQDRDAFYSRWLAKIARDPAYNRNLSLKMASFTMDPGLREGWDPFIKRVLPSVMALPVNSSAVGHYRVSQPFQALEDAGWLQGRVDYSLPELIQIEREKPDIVVFQYRSKASSVVEMERLVRSSSARHIYEIDDYIIDVPKRNDHSRNIAADIRNLVERGISMCDRLVVSTEPLADALSSMHQDIRVVPNMLAAGLWTGLASERQTAARPRVGWAGGTSHRGDLELLLEVIKTLADEVDWVFFGMCPEPLRPYVKEFHQGIPMTFYPQKLASLNLDLALAPLEQNLFNDCKSNLRLLEYGACGFPVICSDTKAYAGYLPCTRVTHNRSHEWLDAIRMHLADPDASYRQGDALRETVLRDYVLNERHLQHWANAWLAD